MSGDDRHSENQTCRNLPKYTFCMHRGVFCDIFFGFHKMKVFHMSPQDVFFHMILYICKIQTSVMVNDGTSFSQR